MYISHYNDFLNLYLDEEFSQGRWPDILRVGQRWVSSWVVWCLAESPWWEQRWLSWVEG